jgi:Asp-tRNA(Asn)/Glu-tRNA(Gln) amidotransferase A subunit family amidase
MQSAAAATSAPNDLNEATIAELQAAMAAGLPSTALVRFYQERIAALDQRGPQVNSIIEINQDARAIARRRDAERRAGLVRGPLHGIPVVLKDNIDTADRMQTAAGSLGLVGAAALFDSTVAAKLRAAGAVILGKTVTTELALLTPAKTRNPHKATHAPGGSSAGSAAAVAAEMVPAALGTQVVGSILRPASFCGAVGFKPSVGAINRSGSHDHFSQSCQGAIGATLADTWAVLRAIADRTGGDPGFVGLTGDVDFKQRTKPAKLGVLETYGWKATTEGARKAFAAAKQRLQTAGLDLHDRTGDADIEAVEQALSDALELTQTINAWEGRWPLNTYNDMDPTKLSQAARDRLRTAEAMTQQDFAKLLARRESVRATYAKAAAKYDAFITVGACGAAPIGLGTTGSTAMNVSASLLGCPALTIPVLADEGLPLGLQLLGRTNEDAALFEVATALAAGALGRPDLVGAIA